MKAGLLLSQQRYIRDLLHKTIMVDAKPITSLMSSSSVLSAFTGDPMEDLSLYRSTVGSLQYLSLTHLDLAFSINRVCQFMHRPTKVHWQAVKRTLQHLKHTITPGLLLQKTPSTSLQPSPMQIRQVALMADALHVSRSATEAKYKSIANTAAKLLWIQSLLRDLRLKLYSPPKLWCDNIGATYLLVNPVFHARIKHVEIDFHFDRESVAAKSLEILFIPSSDQLADVLTKPLVSKRFHLLCFKLNVRSPPLNLQEGINAQQTSSMSNLLKSPSETLDRASN